MGRSANFFAAFKPKSATLRLLLQEASPGEPVESGDMIGAISIARRLYSYDLTAAKQLVETTAHKQPTPR
jgi:hypothetical protein